MTAFKVGDKVRALEDWHALQRGEVYTVAKVRPGHEGETLDWRILEVEGNPEGFYFSRFKLVEAAKPVPESKPTVVVKSRLVEVVESVTLTMTAEVARSLLGKLEGDNVNAAHIASLCDALKGVNLT